MGKTLRDEDLRLNIIINGDKGRKEMAALERSIHDTNAKLEALYAKRKKLESQGKADTASYRSVQAQIGKYNKELDNNRAKLAALQRQQSINTMTLSELRAHINRVQIQLNKTDPKTPLWAQLNSELKASKQRLAEMSAQSKVTGGVVCNMAERINRYIGLITAGFASMTFAISGINRARRIFQEYDEAIVDAMKTTNLARHEMDGLSVDLAKIDTRTSQNELLALIRIGGKLGIKGRDNLLAFAGAADKINVALKEDLGGNAEEAIRQIGKLIDIFDLEEKYGLENSMLMTGSAINELGMASTANEGYIVDFTKRVAGIAPNADIAIHKILGLAATLDKYGQMTETSATAIGQTIVGMYRRPSQFAKVAKMDLKEFLDLLKTDANEAFLRVLERMNTDSEGMFTVVKALDSLKLNGQRASTVLGSLSKHSEELRNQQEISNEAFYKGNSIIEEFNKKNESATAIMEKAKKAVTEQAVALGRQLTPAITMSLSASTWFIRIMGSLVTFITKYHALLIGLAVAYNAHAIAQKTMVAWDKLAAIWKQRNILFSNQYRIVLTREAIAIHATRNAETAASKATMLWCAAKNLLVGNIRAATLAMKAFFVSMGAIGWITLGLSALATVVGGLVTHYKNANKAQRLLSDNMKKATTDAAKERAELDRLKGKLEGCRKGTKEYNDTKAEIISKFGKYDRTLKSETLTVDTLASKYDNLTAAIDRTYNARHYEKFSSEQSQLLDQTMTKNLDKIYSRLIKKLGDEKGTKIYTKILNSILGGEKIEQDVIDILDKIQGKGTIAADSRIDSWIRNIREAQKAASDLDALARARFGIPTTIPAHVTSATTPSTDNPAEALGVDGDFGDDGKWSLDKDAAYQQRRHTLKKQYLAGEIETEREYNRQLLALEIATLQRRLKLNVDDAEERAKIQNTLDDKLLQQRDQNNKWSLGSDDAYMAAQLDLKKRYLNKEIQSESEYDDLSLQLEITALQNRLEKNVEKGEDRISLEQQLADKLLSQQKRNNQRQAEADEILAAVETDLIAQENRRYEQKKKQFAGQANVLEALAKQHERNITKVQLDSANDRLAREEAQYKLSRKMLQNQHRQELSLFVGNSYQRKALRKRQFEELAALDAEHLKGLTDQLQSLIDTGQIDDIKLDVSLLSNEEIIALKNQLQDAVAQLQNVQGGEDGSETKPKIGGIDNGADFLGLSKSQWADLFSGNLEGWEDWADSIADVVSGIGSQTMQLWSSIDKLQTAQENRQLKEFEKNNNKKKKALEKRLNSGLITEAQYNAEVEAMDAEYEAYQEELAIKQAKRQKAMQIADATINTAVAVTKTFAEWGWPWGIVPAAIQSALGLAQIALIASTPISTGAEDGGFQNVTRRQDGRRFSARLNPDKRGFINSPTLLVAENGEEYVIPAEGLRNPSLLPFINTMETARRNGTLRYLNFESVYPAVVSSGLAAGGMANQQSLADPNIDFDPDALRYGYSDPTFLRMLYSAVTKLTTILSKPIKADVSLMGRGNLLERMDEYERMKRRGKIGG